MRVAAALHGFSQRASRERITPLWADPPNTLGPLVIGQVFLPAHPGVVALQPVDNFLIGHGTNLARGRLGRHRPSRRRDFMMN